MKATAVTMMVSNHHVQGEGAVTYCWQDMKKETSLWKLFSINCRVVAIISSSLANEQYCSEVVEGEEGL